MTDGARGEIAGRAWYCREDRIGETPAPEPAGRPAYNRGAQTRVRGLPDDG
jgi:hypothetical protein